MKWTPKTMGSKGGKATSQRKIEAARRNWDKAVQKIREKRENKLLTTTKRLV
jgi:hypothetical protein